MLKYSEGCTLAAPFGHWQLTLALETCSFCIHLMLCTI